MRMRLYSSLREQKKTTVKKQKMDSRRRGKRKSPSQDIIFEVSDNDMSSENTEDECNEPEAKISKIDVQNFMSKLNDLSNLQNHREQLQVTEEAVNHEPEQHIEISEHISVSNSSAESNSESGSDIIVISEDNIDVINDSEECYSALRAESVDNVENLEDKSVDSSEIIDITDENSEYFTDPALLPEETPVSNSDQHPDSINDNCKEKESAITVGVEADNLEEGELEASQIEVQNEESVDVTNSSSIEVDVQNVTGDELDTSKRDPCICITFCDEKIAELYKLKFLKFLQEFVELEVENSDGLSIIVEKDATLNPNEWVILDETMCLRENNEQDIPEEVESTVDTTPEKASLKKKKKRKNKKGKELFILDTNPSKNDNDMQFTKYSTKFLIDTNEKIPDEEIIKISAQTCFNCDSNHAIKDCPLPKDFAKINAARQRFKAQKQTARYHLEEDQKYSHLAPGKISDRLREALGLRRHDLPPFIYHMRVLGYPPGWLEEAKLVHSNLDMFDSEGNTVRDNAKKSCGLDPDKIVDYPGFNTPLEKNVKDEHRQYRVPPYSEVFSKQAMIDYFDKHYSKEQDDMETCDMDLDTTFEEKEKPPNPEVAEETITNPLINELKEIDTSMPSPSLTDLEKEKEKLLAALEDNSSSNPKSVETASEDPGNCSDQGVSEKVPVDKALKIDVEKADDSNTSFASPPLNTSVNCVKNSSFGTPILKSSSPYSKLPNPDNFMKDVSPVINFENLPNSTGKYEQMTGVLQKVRSTLKGKQSCKS